MVSVTVSEFVDPPVIRQRKYYKEVSRAGRCFPWKEDVMSSRKIAEIIRYYRVNRVLECFVE